MIQPSPGLNQYTPLSSTNLAVFSDSQRKVRPSSRERKIKQQQYPLTDSQSTQIQPRVNSQDPLNNTVAPFRNRELQLSQLESDKHYFMKNALESKYRLKEREAVEEENQKLKQKLKELQQRQKNLTVLVENQKSQLEEVERQSPRSILADSVMANSNDQMPSGNKRTGSLTSRKPFNGNHYDSDHSPSYLPAYDDAKYSARDLKPTRNSTPRSLKQQPEPMSNDYINSLHNHSVNHPVSHSIGNGIQVVNGHSGLPHNGARTMYHPHSIDGSQHSPNNPRNSNRVIVPNNFATVYNKPNTVSADDIVPDDVIDSASPEELKHYIRLLKQNYILNDKKNKQEMDNLRFKNQRLEISDAQKDDVIQKLLNELNQTDSQLKDKEKELTMVYDQLQNTDQRRPGPNLTALNHNPNGIISTPLGSRRNSNSGNQPFFENGAPAHPNGSNGAAPGSIQGNAAPTSIPQTPELTDDNIRISTHGKLTRITVWSNKDRIFGLSFQYVKDDGVFIEGNNSFFFNKNLQYDCYDLTDEDELKEIYGTFNISGVQTLTIQSMKQPQRTYASTFNQNDDTDHISEVFAIPLYKDENYLKIVFPNIFTYNMKGAQIEDKQDQNFFYAESNRITSLNNVNIQNLAKKLNVNPSMVASYRPNGSEKNNAPYVAPANPLKLSNPPAVRQQSVPQAQTPSQLPDEYQSMRPQSHYFSDYYESYQIQEAIEPDQFKANFSDADLLFPEPRTKVYKVKIWADDYWIYGFRFTYLTPDGYGIFDGQYHIGIENLIVPYDEIVISQPEVYIQTIQYWKKNNSGIEKLVIVLSNGEKKQYGKNIPSQDAKEYTQEADIFSYFYGTLGVNPDTMSPGNLICYGIQVGVKEDAPM